MDELKPFTGNTYAITGENGKGKSSFATLIKYTIDHIADPSFNVSGGNIIYPGNSVKMIPQKVYIPYQASLLNLILYPDKLSHVNPETENKITDLINELQVFVSPITRTELYTIKDSWQELSGGQKHKLFMVKPLLGCPKVLVMDETFGPLDPKARGLLMEMIEDSCLNESLILVIWHKDKNEDGTSCVREPFFDYELHLQNETLVLGKVEVDCLH